MNTSQTLESSLIPNITEEQVQFFVDNGYLVAENVVTPPELGELEADLIRWARGHYQELDGMEKLDQSSSDEEFLKQILCIHMPHRQSDVIMKFCTHPGIAHILSKITGAHLPADWWNGSVKCMQSMFFGKGPGMPGQAWHQDEIYIPTRDRSLIGAWIAIDDASIDNGCLWVLPGSHKQGVLFDQHSNEDDEFDFADESYGFDDSQEIPVEVKKGSVVFFNGYLLHRSRKNRSDRYRRVLVNHYMTTQSRLPWGAGITHENDNKEVKVNIASMDVRRVFVVSGEDAMAHKGYDLSGKAHLRRSASQKKSAD